MKSFKLSFGEGNLNTQLKWLGALMLVIAITLAAVSVFNYSKFPEEPENGYTTRALILKEFYIAASVCVLGLIFLIAGAFASDNADKKKQ